MIGPTEIVFGLMAFLLIYFCLGGPALTYEIIRQLRPPTERALIKTVKKHRDEEEMHRRIRQEAEFELRELRKRAREVAA